MLVLLPPSEGKTAPASGPPLDLASLSHPELTAARERVLGKVVELSAGAPRRALAALGLSPGQADELPRNAALRRRRRAGRLRLHRRALRAAAAARAARRGA